MAAKKRRHWPWILLTFLVVVGGAGFAAHSISAKPPKIEADKLANAERIDLARSVVATGKIEPVTKVEIKSKASGIIERLPVNVGDYVHKGQVICELDQKDLLPAVREQEAALHVAQANLESANADYAKYKVDAQGADLPFLKRDMERARKLFAEGLIAQSAKDDTEKAYEVAVQNQASAQANLSTAHAAINKAQAALDQQQAALALAQENLRNATIASPIDGIVLSRDSEVGTAVSSILVVGSSATLIMTIGDLNEVYVKGKVDETDIGKVYMGQPARITVESFKDQKFNGRVTKISPMGEEKDNVTTFEVRVSISNAKHILKADMSANAEIVLDEHKHVIAIPEGAVLYNKDKSTAVQVPDPAAKEGFRKVAIVTGISNGAKTEVLQGLAEGQQVILQ